MLKSLLVWGILILIYPYWMDTLRLSKKVTFTRSLVYLTIPATFGGMWGIMLQHPSVPYNTALFGYGIIGLLSLILEFYGDSLCFPTQRLRDGYVGHADGYYFEKGRYRYIGSDSTSVLSKWVTYQSVQSELCGLLVLRAFLTTAALYAITDVFVRSIIVKFIE